MGSMMKRVYYREPAIYIRGKRAREITPEKLLEIKKHQTDLYGRELSKIEIEYNWKTKEITVAHTLNVPALYFEPKNYFKYSTVFYSKECGEPKKVYLVAARGKAVLKEET